MKDDIMKIGILGTGKMAAEVASAIDSMDNVMLHAVASRDLEDACSFALKHDLSTAYGKYEELMEDDEIDLVYIPSPHAYHAFYASQCIGKGKPVLLEKTFAVNANQAEALIAKAEKENVFIGEAMWSRFTPMAARLRNIIEEGRIGRINSISVRCGEDMRDVFRITEPELGGGALLEKGVDGVDLIMWLLGTKVTDITSEGRRSKRGIDLEDNVIMAFKDENEEARCMIYSSVIGSAENTATIYGTSGYILIRDLTDIRTIQVYDSKGAQIEKIDRPEGEENRYVYCLEACRKALADGKLELDELTHQETVIKMKVMDLIRQGMEVRYPFE